jgi:hypothetical protein
MNDSLIIKEVSKESIILCPYISVRDYGNFVAYVQQREKVI